jgi:hypothetical protein
MMISIGRRPACMQLFSAKLSETLLMHRSIWLGFGLVAVASLGCSQQVGSNSGANTGTASAPAATEPEPPPPAVDPEAIVNHSPVVIPGLKSRKDDWTKVEKLLLAHPGVKRVSLSAQKDEEKIDDPVVYVGYSKAFESAKLMEALKEAGYPDSALRNF